MSINSFTKLIGSARYKLAQNTNTNIQLGLEEKTKPLTEYNIIDIVNQYQVFLDERESSKKYRFNGRFNIYTSNVLSPDSAPYVNGKINDTSWSPMFYGAPPALPVTPSNWLMQITYPSNSDSNFLINARTPNGTIVTKAYQGLQYQKLGTTIINGQNYLTIVGVQSHNLIAGDYVYIYSNFVYNSLQGIYIVKNVGINGDNLKTDLTLDIIINPTTIPFGFGNFVRIVNPSNDDLSYSSPSDFIFATSTDISGNTTGSFTTNETIYTTIKTVTPHKLVVNDFVDIRFNSINTLNGVWRVYNTIGGSGSTQFVVKANVSPVKGTVINYSLPYPKFRLLNATPSEYYIRNFEVLTSNEYSVYPCSYSSNIYSDTSDITISTANDTWLFQFDEDVDVERLKTNRNGPISEVYYAVTKRSGKNPYDWTNVTADWDFNYKTTNTLNGIENISINNPFGIGSIEKFSARTETIDVNGDIKATEGSKYIGDFVDYNCLNIREITVSEIIHRFGLQISANTEGYYYKPFKKLDLRKYSVNIETADSDETIIDVPENYVTYPDGSIAWRDLLSIGYFEEGINGVDYPFLNTAHYFYFNHNLFVRRQDPKSATLIDQNGAKIVTNIQEKC